MHRRRSVVPKMGKGMSTARRTGICVGEISETFRDILLKNGRESVRLVSPIREVLVSVKNRPFVPFADAFGVGAIKIKFAGLIQRDHWGRIIHDRSSILSTGSEVVLQSEGVADLMGGQ